MSRFLIRRGFELLIAVDGAEGVQLARERQPDLVLLDLSLPVMDGWEVIRRLRGDAQTRRLPIIALSAHALRGDRDSALAAGADAFEPKPVDVARLTALMDALLARGAGTLTRPGSREYLRELVGFAVDGGRAAGASEAVLEDVRLAVEEVCLNVMTHGYGGGAAGPITVAVERQGDRLVVRISDTAPLFDPAKAPEPVLGADLAVRRPGGLGWHLVRRTMDEVRHEPRQPAGNEVSLIKHLG